MMVCVVQGIFVNERQKLERLLVLSVSATYAQVLDICFDMEPFVRVEDDMPRSYDSLTLDDAKKMLSGAEARATRFGIAYNIAVVDAGGHLIAFMRQDSALIGSIDLAIDKAATARLFDKTTAELSQLSQSGKPLFGIQESNAGKVVIFGGGIPVILNGAVIGAVGASAGSVEQDIAVAQAAIDALGFPARSRPTTSGDCAP
jgi:uncharacterized protein GlcG (DUF336 family)